MMTIICGKEPKNLLNTAGHIFDIAMCPEWFNDPLVEEIVLDVDKTKHFRDQVFESPVLGVIPPERLSGGVKGLICIMKCDRIRKFKIFRSSIFGDNCVKWLARLSFDFDFSIYMSHSLDWYFGGDRSDREFHNTAVKAIGKNGEILSTCGEISVYFASNYLSADYDVPEEDKSDFEDAIKDTTMFSTPKYEDTVEYLHSREFYEKNASRYNYLVAWDDPVTQEYLKLSQELEEAKASEEQEKIVEKLMNLSWWKI